MNRDSAKTLPSMASLWPEFRSKTTSQLFATVLSLSCRTMAAGGSTSKTVVRIVGAAAVVGTAIFAYLAWQTTLGAERRLEDEAKQLVDERIAQEEARRLGVVSTATITDPVDLADPANCSYRTGKRGFWLHGEATMLADEKLWVLTSPDDSSSFRITTNEPISVTQNHDWSVDTDNVGDATDPSGAQFTFLVVRANYNGSALLQRAYYTSGKIDQLPSGVKVMTTGCAERM